MKLQDTRHRPIFCTGCQTIVEARLTDGRERYPHRPDLADIPFWTCDTCHSWVGCHHKTKKPTMPLGVLATKEIKLARAKIHELMDPLWEYNYISRAQIYAHLSHQLGYTYHAGELRSIEEARTVYRILLQLKARVLAEAKV